MPRLRFVSLCLDGCLVAILRPGCSDRRPRSTRLRMVGRLVRHTRLNNLTTERLTDAFFDGTPDPQIVYHRLLFDRCNGKRGWFPSNYVQIIETSSDQTKVRSNLIYRPQCDLVFCLLIFLRSRFLRPRKEGEKIYERARE